MMLATSLVIGIAFLAGAALYIWLGFVDDIDDLGQDEW